MRFSYKGCGFDSRRHCIFLNFRNLSSRSLALELTQPLTEMKTMNLSRGKEADNLTDICEPIV
jgi:hypothetical protein